MEEKKYKDYGVVDFKDYQIEQVEEQCEKDMEEIEGEVKNEK